MSFERGTIEDAVYAVASAATGVPWIVANQDGDRPARPYGTLFVASAEPLSLGDTRSTFDAGTDAFDETLVEVYEVAVSLNAFGREAADVLAAVRDAMVRPSSFVGVVGAVRLGVLRFGSIRDLSEVVSAAWEHRAQVDVLLSARFDSTISVDRVDSVDISGAGGTQTVEVP